MVCVTYAAVIAAHVKIEGNSLYINVPFTSGLSGSPSSALSSPRGDVDWSIDEPHEPSKPSSPAAPDLGLERKRSTRAAAESSFGFRGTNVYILLN